MTDKFDAERQQADIDELYDRLKRYEDALEQIARKNKMDATAAVSMQAIAIKALNEP